MQRTGANQEYRIEKISVVGSCDDDGGGKGAEESDERVHRREKINLKA
jgi:hypothetical protein